MKNIAKFSVGLLLFTGLCAGDARGGGTDCMKNVDLKEFGITIEKVVQGSDMAISTDEVISRKLTGTLVVMNKKSTMRHIYVNFDYMGPAFPNVPLVKAVYDNSGATHLGACRNLYSDCISKTLNSTPRTHYQWTID
ncbi:MAG: hypothetical protein ACREIM_00060 [Nitrospiraceae bacterium]